MRKVDALCWIWNYSKNRKISSNFIGEFYSLKSIWAANFDIWIFQPSFWIKWFFNIINYFELWILVNYGFNSIIHRILAIHFCNNNVVDKKASENCNHNTMCVVNGFCFDIWAWHSSKLWYSAYKKMVFVVESQDDVRAIDLFVHQVYYQRF